MAKKMLPVTEEFESPIENNESIHPNVFVSSKELAMSLSKKMISWATAIFLLTLTVGCEFPEAPEQEEEDRFNVPQMSQQ